MQRNQPEKIRQHTVAKRYLKGFAVDDRLIQHDRETGNCYPVNVDDASVVKRIYSIQRPNGEWDDSIEDYFMRLEEGAGPILKKLIAGIAPTKKEKCIFGLYVARQMQRGQFIAEFARREASNFRDPVFVREFLERRRDKLVRRYGLQTIDDALRDFALNPQGVEIDPKTYLRFIIPDTPSSATIIADSQWRLERSKKEFFITSDQPACVRRRGQPVNSRVIGLLEDNAELYFPLDKSTLLITSKALPRVWKAEVGAPRVREINRILVIHAFRFIFSPVKSPEIEALINEHKADHVRFPDVPW